MRRTTDQARTPNEGVRRAGVRLLIVDDEPLIGTTLKILLSDHEVTVLTSGREARDYLAGGAEVDAILCDLSLEDVSGPELARWLESSRPELSDRMVLMSGGAFTDESREFLESLPASRRLDKPFTAEQVQAVIDDVC